MSRRNEIFMIGPAPTGRGGMASVIAVYATQGLFARWPVRFVPTHIEGNVTSKLMAGARAICAALNGMLRGQVAVLHIHVAQRTSFYRKALFAIIAMTCRVPYIFHMHGSEFREFYSESSAIGRRLIRLILRRAWNVISLSDSWRQWVLSVEPKARVIVVYNPIAMESINGGTPSERTKGDVLFLGRLGHRKGIYDLLEAIVQLKESFPDVRLICGGDGEVDEVRAKARELGIEKNVAVVGWVDGEAKRDLQNRAAVYVLPSYNEGLPMAILESMAAGIPVLASNVGGIPDAIDDGVDGFLVSPGDVSALTDRLALILSDPNLAREIGRRGQLKAAQKFAAPVVFDQLGELYRRIGCTPKESHQSVRRES